MNKKTIKITYLVDFYRTINGGTENQIRHLLSNLPSKGYLIEFISLQKSKFLKDIAPKMFPDISFRILGAKSDISKSIFPLFRLFFILKKSNPDIVHTFFPASNSIGVLIARFAGIRTIISSRRDMGFNLTRKDILMLKVANRFATCILSNSKAVQNCALQLEGFSKAKAKVIYNGISIEPHNGKEMNGITKNDIIIGIVANLNRPVKRVDLFIKAAEIVSRKVSKVKFWIIGDGNLRKGLEQMTEKLGINSKVSFLGRRSDVHKLLPNIDVGVICSDSEGFSNSIMEYMLNNIPVVATNVGGNPELVEDGNTGILVQPDDSKSLANGILKCIENPELATKMTVNGKKKIVGSFSKQNMLKATQTLYNELVRRK